MQDDTLFWTYDKNFYWVTRDKIFFSINKFIVVNATYMKALAFHYQVLWLLSLVTASLAHGQIDGVSPHWSQVELRSANTTKAARHYMNSTERDIITILNLARLYPRRFVELELTKDQENHNNEYKRSLVQHMMAMEPLNALIPSQSMYDLAHCWAKESGELGLTGHKRLQCNDGFFAECCSYGHNKAISIVLQLLIDRGVPDLGHRKICLSNRYAEVGVSLANHSAWEHVCVLDFYP